MRVLIRFSFATIKLLLRMAVAITYALLHVLGSERRASRLPEGVGRTAAGSIEPIDDDNVGAYSREPIVH